jgi:hypothetical protein
MTKLHKQILKRDIHLPESRGAEVSAVSGYPPRLSITAQTSWDFTSPKIQVEGLDRECGFNLFLSLVKSKFKIAIQYKCVVTSQSKLFPHSLSTRMFSIRCACGG